MLLKTWIEFKSILDSRSMSIQYIETKNHYHIDARDGWFEIKYNLLKTTPANSDQTDFETNYKPDSNQPLEDRDIGGRVVNRFAATRKGWHYQAHSVQFEVNKLNSVYNKDFDGNDLGFASLKIYDGQGQECTTQLSADANGVKTIVKWSPDFDFEIISGSIRQELKETIDSYIYVRARIATGLEAPNDWINLNFTQGGINISYIGADEPLKTDGRAAKLVKGSNGDHFELIANYAANLITNENRHKMSIIFEIYKDPLT